MKSPIVQKTADITGAVLSQLCLIHCLLLPLLLSLLPSVTWFDHAAGEAFHAGLLLLATPVTLFALLQGFRRHACRKPAVFGAAGLVVLWLVFGVEETISHDLVAAFNVMGGLLVAAAHWQNWSHTLVCDKPCVHTH